MGLDDFFLVIQCTIIGPIRHPGRDMDGGGFFGAQGRLISNRLKFGRGTWRLT